MSANFTKSRLLALLCAVIMLFTMIPLSASASTIRYAKTSTGEAVNIHSDPAVTTINVIGHVPYGGKVTVITEGKTWSYVSYGAKKGYMLTRLLTDTNPGKKPTTVTPASKTGVRYVKTTGGKALSLYPERKKANAITTIPYGTKVTLLKDYGTWAFISVGKNKGYVVKSALSVTRPTTNSGAHTMIVRSNNKKGINFRSAPQKKKGNVIMTIPGGSKVTAYSSSGGWTRVKYGSVYGYIQTTFLREP